MSDWYNKNESGFVISAKERDYVSKTLSEFTELTNDEANKLEIILKKMRIKQ